MIALVNNRLIPTLWLLFWGYWGLAAFKVQKAERAESALARMIHLILVVAAFALVSFLRNGFLTWRLWPDQVSIALLGALVTLSGLGFALWARLHLGTNWSGTITIKTDHQLIRSGPYALVRHPIYTGVVLAMVGTAIAIGEVRGVLAVLLLIVAYIRKIRMEESWLVQEFDGAYVRYQQEVRALIPFAW